MLAIASLGKQLQERDEFRKGEASVKAVIIGNGVQKFSALHGWNGKSVAHKSLLR